MNRTIATAALLGLAFAVTAPTDDASAAGIAAAGALKTAADQAPATEGVTPVHYWGYGGYYRPYYGYGGYYRPYYGYNYGYGRRHYGGYGYGYGRGYYGYGRGYGYRRW